MIHLNANKSRFENKMKLLLVTDGQIMRKTVAKKQNIVMPMCREIATQCTATYAFMQFQSKSGTRLTGCAMREITE